jgi:hypothetical protein
VALRCSIASGLLLILLTFATGPLAADDYYDVVLANRLVCRLREAGGHGSVSERGSAVEKNVVEALSVENVGSPRMWTKTVGGYPAIYVGGTFLVQVRPGDARGTGLSTSSLARQWLSAFRQQFPRAEPVTKMGKGASGRAAGTGGGGALPTGKREVVVPDEDRDLVAEVGRLLTDSRAMTPEDFDARAAAVADEAATLVWRCTVGGSTCETLDTLPGADQALQSTLNGLKFAREAPSDSFEDQRPLIAYTIVKRVRAAMQPGS